jgi:hypothetical protein
LIINELRYIGKETNNLDEVEITGLDEEDYLEYTNDHEIVNSKEFLDWVLTLKSKDVMDKEILKMALWKVKNKMKHDKQINPKIKSV